MIVSALKTYPNNENVIRQASWAIRNMSVRNKEDAQEFIELGIEEILLSALSTHKEKMENDVKAAMRDLDLEVQFTERWTGKGGALSNN